VVATSQADTTATQTAEIKVVASGFHSTGEMSYARAEHTATLVDGKVLVIGGCYEDSQTGCVTLLNGPVELFDPSTGSFTATGSLETPRTSHTATLLSDGKVLVAGGYTVSGGATTSAELYDPAQGAFTTTGDMAVARFGHTATALSPFDGRVLITGGASARLGGPLASAELYDPATGTFAPTGSMHQARIGYSATLLLDGRVLIAGGYLSACGGCIGFPDDTAELYDPTTGVFTLTGTMEQVRAQHSATRLWNGQVLIAGGDPTGLNGGGGGCTDCIGETNEAEVYDPSTGTFRRTGDMTLARASHSATMLLDGKVLLAGGTVGDPAAEDEEASFTAELYDPATNTFSRTGSMASARILHTATLLGDGAVLVVGGEKVGILLDLSLSSAEIYK